MLNQKQRTSSLFRQLDPPDHCLVLEDGALFPGWSMEPTPIEKPAFGEAVFNTAMVGYEEVLTDPSYQDQLVVMTYPHQGNYGIREGDRESLGRIKAAGLIVHEMCTSPSNHASEESLLHFLQKYKVPYLCGVETRKLTLHIRNNGALRGLIVSNAQIQKWQTQFGDKWVSKVFSTYPSFEGRDLIKEVTTKEPYWYSTSGNKTVAVLDFGVKTNMLRSFASKNCKVIVLPASTTAAQVLSYKPNGIFLSNGPGDPSVLDYAIETTRQLLGKVPLFGVCMGHQVLALALGAKTYKMRFGHRGINQPVLNTQTKSVEISSHNHGFAVDSKTLPPGVIATHLALNDEVCEGIACLGLKAFSVQYHPESSPGPHDSDYLFDDFLKMMSN